MADTKISGFTAATAFSTAHEYLVNEAGVNKKVTGTQIIAGVKTNYASLRNASIADQTINAATTAYLTGSNVTVPSTGLQVGTVFKYRISVSKTAAGTAANTFHWRLGTAGTTADTALLSFALPTATAAIDVAFIDITVTVRGPLGASAIAVGHLALTHNLASTGFATIPCVNIQATSAAFATTTASLIAGLSCTTAASTVLTFKIVTAETENL